MKGRDGEEKRRRKKIEGKESHYHQIVIQYMPLQVEHISRYKFDPQSALGL